MATGSISLRLSRASVRQAFAPVSRRLERPFDGAAGKMVVRVFREQVAKEFAGAFWFHPAGGRRPWEKTHDFGKRKASARPLQATGRYFRALMGGAGAIERITPRRVVVGASSVYGAVHRGGSGADIRTSPVYIRPRKRAAVARPRKRGAYARQFSMFWRLLGDYGVPLRAETLRRGLRLPRRPHMTRHPEGTRRIARQMERWIAKGKIA